VDDPVREYVPEVPDFAVPITIRHLVHHTSGLRDQWELLSLAGWRYSLDLITNADVLALVSRQKDLNFAPGSRFMYSNTGYTLMGEIVQRVSGQSFRECTRARIFEPLGMRDTHFRDDHAEIVKRAAYGYVPRGSAFRLSITNFDTVGATSLLTTVRDLARWDQNFYTGQVGGSAFLEQMLQRGTLSNGELLSYAFGLMITPYRGLPTVNHAGADAGYRAELIRFPDQRFGGGFPAILAPTIPASLARKVADIYLAGELEPSGQSSFVPSHSGETELARIAGLYVNEADDDFVRIEYRDGRAMVA